MIAMSIPNEQSGLLKNTEKREREIERERERERERKKTECQMK